MVFKIPKMNKEEYDTLVNNNHVSRIAFSGSEYPYIAPFLYVFDGQYMYFLSTKYGRKIELLKNNPYVSVEIDKFSEDMSCFKFITLQGKIVEEENAEKKVEIKKKFVDMIISRGLSNIVLEALGQNSEEPVKSIITNDNTHIWKLTDIEDIVALKNEKSY
ncbi:nitroimidazol reductase NimA-like FMN-containing flavoprotein (pyridoxamine 5'-phosphate oxidase superfamily) [Methanococcus voltae]|uniref:Nitroimidazol reductase NimA-like FMN-containing flavoprotein (Pyridoxamine 5'-phosphate oxidase superfamily) n=1 Tax=Methanococcus voltae TaxID=2188 RepID=A0A8J7RIF3_METVO|nr:pyridoxamine 5'-phosphate oxidase family protein [Methanococcus voltae]MBP2202045.1 nitroimidazol reductase NimA-like FMN-containing flavoprotein (pyridoxamine 5'-phosphate oxidase superfamily) [Methanococcus voltae]